MQIHLVVACSSAVSLSFHINNRNHISIMGFQQQCNCFPFLLSWDGRSDGEKGQLCNRSFHVNSEKSVVPGGY